MALLCCGGFQNPCYNPYFEELNKMPSTELVYRYDRLEELMQISKPKEESKGTSMEELSGLK